MLHLYSGATKAKDFGVMPSGVYVLNVDLGTGGNMLRDDVFSYLLWVAKSGRLRAIMQWSAAALDIKTAFLLAPLKHAHKKIVLRPPKILQTNQVVPEGELWVVTGAIYGLQESPSSWSAYRDGELENMVFHHNDQQLRLRRSRGDHNTWLLVRKEGEAGF